MLNPVQEGLQRGLIRQNEVTDIQEGAMARHERRAVDSFIAQDPWAAVDHFIKATSAGKSQFAKRFSPSELADTLATAHQAVNTRTRETSTQLDQAITTGQIANEKSIRDLAAKGRLSEDQIRSHITSLQDVANSTPDQRASVLRDRSLLTTTLENYDPALDIDDKGYQGIAQTIREQVPKSERAAYLGQLQTIREKGRSDQATLTGDIYSQIDTIFSRHTPDDQPASPERQMQVWQKASAIKSQFATFWKSKPNASEKELRTWMSNALGNEIKLRAAKSLRMR